MAMRTTNGLLILILIVCVGSLSATSSRRIHIVEGQTFTFDALGPTHGLYSITYKHPLKQGFKGRITGSYDSERMGYLTISRFPGNVASSYDAFGSIGIEWHPFVTGAGTGNWLTGVYGVSELAVGRHKTEMQSWRTSSRDSLVAKANWLAPTIRIGYEALMGRFIVSPEIGASYRLNRANYDGLRQELFEENGVVNLASRKTLKADNTGWLPVFGLTFGHRF